MFYSYEEIGLLCRRSPETIRTYVSRHHIPRVYAKPIHKGCSREAVALVAAEWVKVIRKNTLGIEDHRRHTHGQPLV